jgi:cyanophycinase
MHLTEARGKLVIVGGAEDKEGDCLILKEFVRLAKGPKARIVLMTAATDEPVAVGREYMEAFKRLGIDDVQVVDVSEREDARSEASIKAIKEATGLYFTGGDQIHVTSLIGGTPMQKVIHERYEKGLVIGGTSAGAAMMGNSMIISGSGEQNPRLGAVDIGPGMDLLIGALIDTHFSERGRHGRLLAAVAHYPQDLGLGIDENTAVVVNKVEFEVIGEGAVTVIDAGLMTYTNLPYVQKGEGLALHGVGLHVLPAGQRFDLTERKPIYVAQNHKQGKSANSGGAKK